MRGFAILPMANGKPDIGGLILKGYVLGAAHGVWGLYFVGGTREQILAVDALASTVVICSYVQLPDIISSAKRAEINAWKDANFPALPDVPASWTYQQVVEELFSRADANFIFGVFYLKLLGLVPEMAGIIKTLAIAPDPPNVGVELRGQAWKLITVGDYAIWQVDSDEDNLGNIHAALYDGQEPEHTMGLIGVVQVFGTSFYQRAVMDYFDHPASEMLARRDRIASYLEAQGYSNTAALRAATTEHAQAAGIVAALGYTMNQLWNVMVE